MSIQHVITTFLSLSFFTQLAARVSQVTGAVGTEFQANTYTTNAQLGPVMALLSDGGFVTAWQSNGQDTSGYGAYGQRYTSNGLTNGNEFLINSYTSSGQYIRGIAPFSDGGFVATWESYMQDGSDYGVYAQRYTADGIKNGGELAVNTYTTDTQTTPSIATLAGDNFVIVWAGYGQASAYSSYGIYGQLYTAEGIKNGPAFSIVTIASGHSIVDPVVAAADGGFVVAWSEFWYSSGCSYSYCYSSNYNFIYGQKYTTSAVKNGDTFEINYSIGSPNPNYVPSSLAIAILRDNGFIVVWQSSNGKDGSGNGIFAQRYTDGLKNGGELAVNTFTTGDQSHPAVASLADGGFIIVWDSAEQDSSAYGIYAQRYSADSLKVGGEFRINTYLTGAQQNPAVIGLQDGGFVMTWESDGQDGASYGIFGQRFDASNTKIAFFIPQPTLTPSKSPTTWPTLLPSFPPTFSPTLLPTLSPSLQPTEQPTKQPTYQPSISMCPTYFPTYFPTFLPTISFRPTVQPTFFPSAQPTSLPTGQPTGIPTGKPTPKRGHPTSTIFSTFSTVEIGIIAGGVGCFLLLCCLGLFCYRRRRTQENKCPTDRRIILSDSIHFTQSESMGSSSQSTGFELITQTDNPPSDEGPRIPTIPFAELVIDETNEPRTGSFGIVYTGSWKSQPVAVKQLQEKRLTARAVAKFREEAQRCWLLQHPKPHPNIVHLFGICTDPGNYSIVMERMVISLHDFLQSQMPHISFSTRFSIACDVAIGLEYLHSRRLLHRDLKSDNVLLRADNQAVISDFGLSITRSTISIRSTQSPTNAPVGTLCWMAPEILDGKAASCHSDVYALGIILWEISSRDDPFQEYAEARHLNTLTALIKKGKRPSIPPSTPPRFSALMKKCWAQRAKDRPGCSSVAADLRELLEEEKKVADGSRDSSLPGKDPFLSLSVNSNTRLNVPFKPVMQTTPEEVESKNGCCSY